jgi:hypothetical protein
MNGPAGVEMIIEAEGTGPKGSVSLIRWQQYDANGKAIPAAHARGWLIECRGRDGETLWVVRPKDYSQALTWLCDLASGEHLPPRTGLG